MTTHAPALDAATTATTRPPKILTLGSTEDLVAARDRSVGLRHQQVVVALPGLTADESTEKSRRLTELLDECGCDTGARAMVAGAVMTFAGLALLTGGPTVSLLALSPLTVVGAVVGAGAGKAYGLARSRRQFRREIAALLHSTGA